MLSVIVLILVVLSVIMLSVIMLNVVAPQNELMAKKVSGLRLWMASIVVDINKPSYELLTTILMLIVPYHENDLNI
jgi:hypothetical protein